ncbi:MAG: hypothetical protein EAS48_02795 [Chryseobacterium sp.]|nr:MAG: hypothetical protein EAS48_02795 [Chryseobacterium sp.]
MKTFEVRIYVPDNKTERWYVYIYNLQTRRICKKFYKGINTTDDRDERMLRCEQFKLAIEAEIRTGWQPDGVQTVKTTVMPFADALEFALSKKAVSEKTRSDYSCTLRFVRKAIKSLRLSQLSIHNCERIHVKTVMDYLEKKHKWKGKNYNKHMSCLSSLFTELVEWDLIKTNPVRDIRARYEEKTEGYIQPTDKQHKKIFARLKEVDYHYYIFCSIEYYLGIRPKEILRRPRSV